MYSKEFKLTTVILLRTVDWVMVHEQYWLALVEVCSLPKEMHRDC